MTQSLGSTMCILHGNPRKGQIRFALELRTEDAPVGPLQFSFPGGKMEDRDAQLAHQAGVSPALVTIDRENSEEFCLSLPYSCYRFLAQLDHVTEKLPLYVFDLLRPAPVNLATREGAGVAWFTAAYLERMAEMTALNPGGVFVMTPATLQVYTHLAEQQYFKEVERLSAAG